MLNFQVKLKEKLPESIKIINVLSVKIQAFRFYYYSYFSLNFHQKRKMSSINELPVHFFKFIRYLLIEN